MVFHPHHHLQHGRHVTCGYCDHEITEILDMGEHALAGAFLKPWQFSAERKYRLRFGVCEGCGGAQVMDKIDPKTLFTDYFYRSSQIATVQKHADAYALDLLTRFKPKAVLEIGCNDGAMLRTFSDHVSAVGIDPAGVAPDDLTVHREHLGTRNAKDVGTFDLVVANHVFAHVPDINDLTEAVCAVLAKGGVFVMEAHHLSSLVAGQYDVIYHEHAYYHSLLHLQWHLSRFGLHVFDAERVGLHGGSLRCFIDRGERAEENGVRAVADMERAQGLDRIETFGAFALYAQAHRARLSELVANSGSVAGYGASGRANTLIQWSGIKLDYIVDDSRARQGMFTPGSHIPICTRKALERAKPDHVLALAWTYLDDLKAKCDRPMIVPFQKPHIVEPVAA